MTSTFFEIDPDIQELESKLRQSGLSSADPESGIFVPFMGLWAQEDEKNWWVYSDYLLQKGDDMGIVISGLLGEKENDDVTKRLELLAKARSLLNEVYKGLWIGTPGLYAQHTQFGYPRDLVVCRGLSPAQEKTLGDLLRHPWFRFVRGLNIRKLPPFEITPLSSFLEDVGFQPLSLAIEENSSSFSIDPKTIVLDFKHPVFSEVRDLSISTLRWFGGALLQYVVLGNLFPQLESLHIHPKDSVLEHLPFGREDEVPTATKIRHLRITTHPFSVYSAPALDPLSRLCARDYIPSRLSGLETLSLDRSTPPEPILYALLEANQTTLKKVFFDFRTQMDRVDVKTKQNRVAAFIREKLPNVKPYFSW